MKLTSAFVLLACLQVSARGFSQRITLKEKNVSLEKVFHEIEKQSGYTFFFNYEWMKSAKPVTVHLTDVSLEEALKTSFINQPFSYEIVNRTIVVNQKKEPEGMPAPQKMPQAMPVKPLSDIKGRVTDETGKPLAGANVAVKGTMRIAITNNNGGFSLQGVEVNATLVVSFVGYESETIRVTSANMDTLNVVLKVAENKQTEVVVIGYGSRTRSTVTGAVSVVGSAQLKNRPTANVVNSLQGLVPGLVVSRGNVGRIGKESDNLSMQIRGVSSRANPGILIIVDGIPQPNDGSFALNNLNPDDIENITVLKDAQAAIYGARAAGGVILITTKSGKTGKPVVSLNSNLSINKPGIFRKQANILRAIDMWTESYENDGVMNNYYSHLKHWTTDPISLDTITVDKGPFPDTKDITLSNNDWMKIMWGNATQQQHSLSVSGKSDKSAYWVSMGMLDQHSMLNYGTNFNRKYNTRLKYDFDVNNWLKFKTNISLQTQKLVEPTDYDLIQDLTAQSYQGKAEYTPTGKYYGFGGYLSTIGWAEKGGNRETQATQIRSQFETVLTPVKNLEITGQLAINRDVFDETALRTGFLSYTYDDEVIFNSNLYWGGKDQVSAGFSKNNQLVGNLYANYKYNVKDHHFGLLVGGSHEEVDYRAFSAYRNGNPNLLNNSLSVLGNGALTEQFNSEAKTQNALTSGFSRLNYDYNDKYFFEGNFRYDASSRFASGHKGTPFYGGSAGWILTREKFLEGLTHVIDFAKIRLSYGQLGNQSGIGLYDYVQSVAFGAPYPMGPSGSPSRSLSTYIPTLASVERTWEKLQVRNAGIDINALKNRLSIGVDYFIKTNKNMFYSKEFPTVLGITPPQINGASLRTKGWEASLGWKDKITRDLNYFVNVYVSDNTNKVVALADSRIPAYGSNSFIEGYSVGSYFTYQYDGLIQGDGDLAKYKSAITGGIPTNIRTGDAKYKDLNGDGKLTPLLYNAADPSKGGDMVYIGNSNMRYSYSVNLGSSYKGIYFTAILQGIGKWMVMDDNVAGAPFFRNPQAYHYHNTWSADRTNALYPKLSQQDGINGYNYLASNAPFKFRNARYLRLKNIQVGYNLPTQWLGKLKLKSVQVYFSGTDLAEWSRLPVGFDPEKPFSIVNTPYPRSYSFGLNASL